MDTTFPLEIRYQAGIKANLGSFYKSKWAKRYLEILTAAGFSPRVTEPETNIEFYYEDLRYLLILDARDAGFISLVLPDTYQLRSDEEIHRGLSAAAVVNEQAKVAKVILDEEGYVWAVTELFLIDPESLRPLLPRLISVLKFACALFGHEMKG